jgi:hypothetical protein
LLLYLTGMSNNTCTQATPPRLLVNGHTSSERREANSESKSVSDEGRSTTTTTTNNNNNNRDEKDDHDVEVLRRKAEPEVIWNFNTAVTFMRPQRLKCYEQDCFAGNSTIHRPVMWPTHVVAIRNRFLTLNTLHACRSISSPQHCCAIFLWTSHILEIK